MQQDISVSQAADEIIAGRRLTRADELSVFITADMQALQRGADAIRRHFCGDCVDLCTIINGRSGNCSEDCKYCAQSAYHHHTGVEVYDSLNKETILTAAAENEREGAHRFAVVTSGRSLSGREFDEMLQVYREMRGKCHFGLCASHGILTAQQLHLLHEAGISSYHHNIETSRRFFPEICSTHTYEDRIHTIRLAQKEGLCVCSGGIIGMGETWEDRLDMAVSLAELGIQSIPINALIPIKGTKLENRPQLPAEDILRTIAFFRYINPTANIRLAAGRRLLPNNGADAFFWGASASITGNMLTTSGTTIREDVAMLSRMGLYHRPDADGMETTARSHR